MTTGLSPGGACSRWTDSSSSLVRTPVTKRHAEKQREAATRSAPNKRRFFLKWEDITECDCDAFFASLREVTHVHKGENRKHFCRTRYLTRELAS